MEKRNFNEVLRERELRQQAENARRSGENEMTLDDAARVKILSPGMLVFKRFIRNKLAIVGSAILICMFLFAFLGPSFYKYGQTQVFTAYKQLNINYANAKERTEYTVYTVEDQGISTTTKNLFNSIVLKMEAEGKNQSLVEDTSTGLTVLVEKKGENIYTMSVNEPIAVGTFTLQNIGKFNTKFGKVTYTGEALDAGFDQVVADAVKTGLKQIEYNGNIYLLQDGVNSREKIVMGTGDGVMDYVSEDKGEAFAMAVADCVLGGETNFIYEDELFSVSTGANGAYAVTGLGESKLSYVASPFVFDTFTAGTKLSDSFKVNALLAIYGTGSFSVDGTDYTVANEEDQIYINTADGQKFSAVSTFVVRRFNGEDTLDIEFKNMTREIVANMEAENLTTSSFTYKIPQLDDKGIVITDEEGNVLLIESELTVNDKVTDYVVVCEQYTNMIDRFAPPSKDHAFGTDGDGMDILARMMAGGRVSLLVGFVVVILEIFLGIIMGGLAGYFGGWVDNLIMRLVDIFYCIPSMPILIIIGFMLDALRLEPYIRLMWLMAVLGFLGWASIARLVRGQILSLRDQDFMIATEATGLPVRRRIFRHLIPNVMPQLIVTATMGLGSVILTESTLSFLGLGVKHPMATWGTMINSVATSAQSMITYTYIWIPVGLLICLTVIAFNFVGDGLRDAFDPKMKR